MTVGFNQWLFKKIYPKEAPERKSIGYLEGWISIVGNTLLFLFKLLAGLYLNSISLIADAFHSLSDVITSGIVIVGFKLGGKPPDKKHPFGHGRIEQIATILIAFILLVVAYDLGKSSLNRIFKPQTVEFNIYILIILIISALFKEWMASFSIFLGEKIDSQALLADAWHHRSDAIAAILVSVGLLTAKFNLYRVDGIMGLIVSGFIAWVGIDIAKKSSSLLIGESPDQKLVEQVKRITSDTPGVLDCHDLSVHDYSNTKFITLHIEVKKDLSAQEAHDIALKVQRAIEDEIPEARVTVHVDPEGERDER